MLIFQNHSNFKPEVIEDTYVDMGISLPRYGEGPKFAKVKKCLRYANCIQIGRQNKNTMLDTRVYGVEYLYGHKASIAANTIAEILFSKFYEEGNRFVLFDDIVDHHVYGTETINQDIFIISSNGEKIQRETTKVWEILIQRKDGSMTWESMKDVKE